MDFALWRTSDVTMLILMDTATIVKRDFMPFTVNATKSISIFESASPGIIDSNNLYETIFFVILLNDSNCLKII